MQPTDEATRFPPLQLLCWAERPDSARNRRYSIENNTMEKHSVRVQIDFKAHQEGGRATATDLWRSVSNTEIDLRRPQSYEQLIARGGTLADLGDLAVDV